METINVYYEDKKTLSEFINKNHKTLFDQNSKVLIQVFSGICEKKFLFELSTDLTNLLPHAHIIGTTTSGEIMNGNVSGLRTVLSFSIFKHTNIRCSFISQNGQTDYELGQSIAAELYSDKAKVLILFATGLTINANDLLKGVETICPTLPVVGGNAGDNSLMQQSFIFSKGKITECGVVGAVLEGQQLKISRHWHLGWQPIGKEMTITKADNLRVYTIDNMPAYQTYQTYLGLDDIGNFQNAVEYPLVMNRYGVSIARIPHMSYEDGSLGFLADINEGEKVRFSYGHVKTILAKIEDLCQEIKIQPAESIFVYSCTSRRGFLQDKSKIETIPLQKIAPTAGFFTYGEFFHAGATNQLLNATMTVLVLSESDKVGNLEVLDSNIGEQSILAPSSFQDNVAGRNIGVLSSLTNLVNTVTNELIEANEKLKYNSLHDALTGLYNRAFFEQETKRYNAYEGNVGIMVCDIGCLKLINDILGHSFGDRIICMAADRLTKACRSQDIIARIGGDEFAVIVPDAEESILEEINETILRVVEENKEAGPNDVLHISVGFALKSDHGDLVEAFKLADLNMYRQKSAAAVKVQEVIVNTLTHIEISAGLEQPKLFNNYINNSSQEILIQREWAENQVRREMERASILLRVSSQLNNSSYESIFDILCEESARAINAPAAYVHLYDHHQEKFSLAARYGLINQSCQTPTALGLFDNRGIMVEDDKNLLESFEKGLIVPSNLKKLVRVRLVYDQQMIGVLSLCIADEDFCFGDNDCALIYGLADLAVVHIVKARLWQDNRKQLEAITLLYDNAQRLAHTLDMSNIAQDVCRTCVQAFGSPLAWVGKAEEDGTIKVIGAYPVVEYPYTLNVRWDDTPLGRGPTGEAMRIGAPVIINDIKKDERFNLWREVALKFGVGSIAGFPLISRGKAFGAIMVYGKNTDFFNPEKTYYLQAYAHQAAAALQNAKLIEEAEKRATHLEALREVDIAITKNSELQITLNTVLDQVMSRLQVDASDILLFEEKTKTLSYAVGKGFFTTVPERVSCHIGGKALRVRKEAIRKEENLPYYQVFHLFAKGKLQGVLELFNRKPFAEDMEWKTFIDMLANQTAIAIDGARLLNGLKSSNLELTAAYDATIEGWSRILDLRDKETEGHSQRVTLMTLELGRALGIEESELIHLRRGALLHDIGKMGIPDIILLKPGALTINEWDIMKMHPVYAYEMLSPIEYLRPALDIPYAHHEKWDGSGYPLGLKGEDIPLSARIFAIVDVYDALSSDRPYRKAWKLDHILEHIKTLRGSHFDPKIVDLFLDTPFNHSSPALRTSSRSGSW